LMSVCLCLDVCQSAFLPGSDRMTGARLWRPLALGEAESRWGGWEDGEDDGEYWRWKR
jgi:hypothetical protein